MIQVGFNPASYTVLEGNSTELVIVREGDAEVPVTVTLSTAGVTAVGEILQPTYVSTVRILLPALPDRPGNEARSQGCIAAG